jgi:hypothetical protein
MRKKAFYTINEIQNNLFTTGSQWMTEDGTEYKGLYHQYATGEIFTQPEWNPNYSVKLIPYEDVPAEVKTFKRLKSINVQYESFRSYNVKLTTFDIQQGQINRYFIKKINEQAITEIDSQTYQKWVNKTIDPNMYSAVEVTWIIAGDKDRAETNNANQIEFAKTTIPNIDTVLTSPLQYYVTANTVVTTDINGLDS